jgi:hypothetical protein
MSDQPQGPGEPPRRRSKHLLDLNKPPGHRQAQRPSMSLTRVQQWVATTVILIVGMGIAIPLAGISPFIEEGQGAPGAAVGLWVMSVVWGLATMVGALVVLGHRLLSPWLLLGVVPAVSVLPLMF